MDSVDLRRKLAQEKLKLEKLKQEQERIDKDIRISSRLVSAYEKSLKQAMRIEDDSQKRFLKLEEALAAEINSIGNQVPADTTGKEESNAANH